MYYLIDNEEDVQAENGVLYSGPFYYNQLGAHSIQAIAYFVCLQRLFIHLQLVMIHSTFSNSL